MATPSSNVPAARPRVALPDPPPVEQFPPAVWPTPEHRRKATIQAARNAGVSEDDITAAGGCARLPASVWGALIVLLILVVWIVYSLARKGGGASGGLGLFAESTGEDVDCTNWKSAGTSVSSALPRCGRGAQPPHILHGALTAYLPGGKPCHSESLTGETADSATATAMSQRAYATWATHPDAYLGSGAYTCPPPGPKSGGASLPLAACTEAVHGTTATLRGETLVGSPADTAPVYGNPSCGSRRRAAY